jgi:hypothetical protein
LQYKTTEWLKNEKYLMLTSTINKTIFTEITTVENFIKNL